MGAVATQSWANPRYGPEGLALLRDGHPAADVVRRLTEADDDRAQRQLGVVDGEGATFAGDQCQEWAGGRTGPGYAAQGNILVSVRDGGRARRDLRVHGRRAARAPAARLPGRRPGRGRRPPGAAVGGLARVGPEQGYAGLSDVFVDLRVDDHEYPLHELRRLFEIHQEHFAEAPGS